MGYGLQREGKNPKNVIKYIFEEASDFVDDVAFVKYGGKYGLIHRGGLMSVDPIYDEVSGFVDSLACCRMEKTYFIINTHRKELCRWIMGNENVCSFLINQVPFDMRLVQKGRFNMGIKSINS